MLLIEDDASLNTPTETELGSTDAILPDISQVLDDSDTLDPAPLPTEESAPGPEIDSDLIYQLTDAPTLYSRLARSTGIVRNGTPGNDVLRGTNGNDTIRGGAGNDRIFGLGGDDLLEGNNGNDRILGGDGRDRLFGNNGRDFVNGEAGNDSIFGNVGNDRLLGGGGRDTLDGGAGNDNLNGGRDNDRLSGAGGNDSITGGQGNDRLVGGLGDDLLDGGEGNNLFVYDSLAERGDQINDFNDDADVIDLRSIFLDRNKYSNRDRFDRYVIIVREEEEITLIRVDSDGENGDRPFVTLATLEGVAFDSIGSNNFVV